ncbi:MAG TPA: radical SAM protein [Syntrophomonas wolfei]|uniref:Radical SAM protein n=1 Tax=Syntrophomonas wolfei TaxID=863 RepID=A0A354YWC5_9FIRM|nr:radical SAM protein [Syntrophomonas wolfei]
MKHINIPIFIPHLGCPFTCVFCDQNRISATRDIPGEMEVINIVENHLATIPAGSEVEIAFFGGNFTMVEKTRQEMYLATLKRYLQDGRVRGIRISTRPDGIDAQILDFLQRWGVRTIELGVQSLSDEVLKASWRGYQAADVFKACQLIKEYCFRLGIQLMIGLPGDKLDLDMKTAAKVIELRPDMVRIYPTLVIAGTHLEKLYLKGKYIPLTLAEALQNSLAVYLQFQKENIPVIRMGLQPGEELRREGCVAAGPFHPAFGELVEQEAFKAQAGKAIEQFFTAHGRHPQLLLFVHPRDISKVTGQRRSNLNYLKEQFGLELIKVRGIENLARDSVGAGTIDASAPALLLSRLEFIEQVTWDTGTGSLSHVNVKKYQK